jgi:hypothetical protein
MSQVSVFIKRIKYWLLKNITVWIFFFLPVRIARCFVSLSIVSMIMSLRDIEFSENDDIVKHVGDILEIELSKEIVLLPQQTFSWYWNDALLNAPFKTENGTLPMREVLIDNAALMQNRNTVFNVIFDKLPTAVHLKLGLYETRKRMEINHQVCRILNHAV